ncbi:MAG: glycosyltransferase, partial [Porticoccaceae bacterium]|nr:glycosyltransferase [Porticoccaceae bacterium]
MAKAALTLAKGFFIARKQLKELRPAALVGFGGYPTVPPMLAAASLGIPTCLHEQNGVLGRANKLLARSAKALAASFPVLKGGEPFKEITTLTGNPVRPAVLEAAGNDYPSLDTDSPLKLTVFGGSQGARFFSEYMPGVIGRLPEEMRSRIELVQQCRPEDLP